MFEHVFLCFVYKKNVSFTNPGVACALQVCGWDTPWTFLLPFFFFFFFCPKNSVFKAFSFLLQTLFIKEKRSKTHLLKSLTIKKFSY